MFTVYVVKQDNNPHGRHESHRNHYYHHYTTTIPKTTPQNVIDSNIEPHSTKTPLKKQFEQQQQRHAPAAISPLVDRLQSSIFFGGFGSLGREIERMHTEMALASTTSSVSDNSSPFSNTEMVRTVAVATDSEASSSLNDQGSSEESTTPWLWRWNGKNTSTDSDKAGSGNSAHGPWKRYRITVEEILEDNNTSEDQEVPHNTITSTATTNKAITTTTVMPSGVMDWLTSFAPQGYQIIEQTNIIPTNSKPVELTQPIVEDLSRLKNEVEATVNDRTGAGQDVEISPDNIGNMDDTLNLSSSAVDAQVQEKRQELDVDRTAISSTAAAAAATTVATMAAISNKASNNNNNNNKDDDHNVHDKYPADHTDTPSRFQRQWPPRRSRPSEQQQQQQQQQHQTYTRTTITRPDGTVESKTVSLNRETGQTETRIHIQRPDGSFHESIVTKLSKEQHQQQPSKSQYRSAFRDRLAQRRQERQERRQERQERRLQERNRTTQDDSETEKTRSDSDLEGEARKKRLERRQEIRDAEARQREATAIAYGAHPPSQSQDQDACRSNNSDSNKNEDEVENEDPHRARSEFHQRHIHRLRHAAKTNANNQALREENKDEERTAASSKGSWPPRAYLRRQQLEKEQGQEQGQEPRHNV